MSRASIIFACAYIALVSELAIAQSEAESEDNHPSMKWSALIDSLVYCQDKPLNAPAVSESMFTSVQFKTVCVPDSFAPAYDEGIEAGCEVRYTVDSNGTSTVDSSVCNVAYHADFVSDENDPEKLLFAKHLYQGVSRKAVEDSRFAISNDFEAQTLGTLVQAYEFLRAEDGGQRFEPLSPSGVKNSTEYHARELVDEPKQKDWETDR